jgi:hypothetical protein
MTERISITVSDSAPLVGIPDEENGRPVTRYFTEEEGQAGSGGRHAFAAIGAAADIETTDEEMPRDLHRLRHESKPTPPLDFDQ